MSIAVLLLRFSYGHGQKRMMLFFARALDGITAGNLPVASVVILTRRNQRQSKRICHHRRVA
jgi:hypothetical protein